MEQLNLPPRIANSPTPRTDAATNRPRMCDPLVKAEFAQQLEREQQWMMEVLEKTINARDVQDHLKYNLGRTSAATCELCQAGSAYTELKKYMEEKK